MQISLSDETTRAMLTEILIDLIKTRKELFSEIIQDALEEIGLVNAITDGRKNEFVPEANIFALLDAIA
jgi:hypothetical protein